MLLLMWLMYVCCQSGSWMGLLVFWQIFILKNIWEIMRHGTEDTRSVIWFAGYIIYIGLDCSTYTYVIFTTSVNGCGIRVLLASHLCGVMFVSHYLLGCCSDGSFASIGYWFSFQLSNVKLTLTSLSDAWILFFASFLN